MNPGESRLSRPTLTAKPAHFRRRFTAAHVLPAAVPELRLGSALLLAAQLNGLRAPPASQIK